METVTRQAIEEAGVPFESVRYVVPHQANLRIISAMAERLGIGPEQLVLNIDRFGNTSAASIPISLDELLRSGKVQHGDVIALVAFGGGVTWGAIVLEWDPTRAHPVAASRAEQGAAAAGVAGGRS
jgi:3-oxoacyl-[acyl-carrier-protein] synthase-3